MKLPGSKGEHQAQEAFGTTRRALTFYNKQMLHYLNPLMREFIARQEMVFIATADAHGACDCSLRAGLPGQTPPTHPLRQWSLKPTGFFRVKPPLGTPHFST